MKTVDKLYGIHSKIKNCMLALGGAGVFIMMIYITVDVLVRNLSSTALVGTFEIVSNYIMPLTILPSMCLALASGVMPRIVAMTNRLPHKAQRVNVIILPILEMAAYILMFLFSTKYAISATQDRLSFVAGTTALPVWFMYYLPPLAYVMMTVESLLVLLKNLLTDNTTILYQGKDPDEENASI